MHNLCKECGPDMLYKPDFVKMDDTYDHNIKIPMTLSYGAVPKSICKHHVHNGCRPATTNNQFKYPLEACAVAGSLNQELLSNFTFLSNEYECSKAIKKEHLLDTNSITFLSQKVITFLVFHCKCR